MQSGGQFFLRRMWSFSRALDLALVDEEVEKGFQVAVGEQHGERVAYIALSLGRELGWWGEDLFHLTIAGLLHDIGAIADFRRSHGDPVMMREHARIGAGLMTGFPAGEFLAAALWHHHATPQAGQGDSGDESVPQVARILSLADKLDLQMPRRWINEEARRHLVQWVLAGREQLFFPAEADAFAALAGREAFWLDLGQPDLPDIVWDYLAGSGVPLTMPVVNQDLAGLLAVTFAELVDQKSSFTARHSRAVAENVLQLALKLGWDEAKCREIYTAGLLHDLGKLAVPNKVLDKPGKLEAGEFAWVKRHTYYTYRLLKEAGFPQTTVEWAAFHHERRDGRGYPFGLKAGRLDTGCGLMKVADIFAALTEERPYRKPMTAGEALAIVAQEAGSGVDAEIVELARKVF